MDTDGCGYSGSDTVSACSGEVVTESGGGDTESSAPGLESPESVGLEKMLRSFLSGQHQQQRQPPRRRPVRQGWNGVACFSCGKSGHAATRCFSFQIP